MNTLYPTILSALKTLRVTLVVVRKEDTVYVEVSAPLYEDKHYRMRRSWSTEFTDAEILKDASKVIASSYGVHPASGFTIHSS